jgi:hypothetical protein
MRDDGTMDIAYHIEWKVLNDSEEGPLNWVKIGIPNKHADTIKAVTDNIKSIKYTSNGGSYVRIDFDRSYYAGEIISFDFSIHQSYMYQLNYDYDLCIYNFIPGWFDEIEVKELTVMWNKDSVIESNSMFTEGDYLLWNTSLNCGERYQTTVKYKLGAFKTDVDKQYVEDDSADMTLLIISLSIIIILIVYAKIDDYLNDKYNGGFGTGYHGRHGTHSSCACARSCACACACACAGGGRAGCSAKNFYGAVNNSDINKLYKVLYKKTEKSKDMK